MQLWMVRTLWMKTGRGTGVPVVNTTPALVWRDCGKWRHTSNRMAGLQAETRTRDLTRPSRITASLHRDVRYHKLYFNYVCTYMPWLISLLFINCLSVMAVASQTPSAFSEISTKTSTRRAHYLSGFQIRISRMRRRTEAWNLNITLQCSVLFQLPTSFNVVK
jgi:hypothetical protein